MDYIDFSLSGVKKQFQLDLVELSNLFNPITDLEPSEFLTNILQENVPLALGSNTEKARSEMIISPILIDLRRQLDRKISLFSGVNFNVESQLDILAEAVKNQS